MSDEKFAKLIRRLSEKTQGGQLDWEATAQEDTFSVSFANYSVHISYDEREDNQYFMITIVDSAGNTIDQVDDSNFSSSDFSGENPEEFLRSIYSQARKIAMGVDEALDDILEEID